jgi:hypothetical protein
MVAKMQGFGKRIWAVIIIGGLFGPLLDVLIETKLGKDWPWFLPVYSMAMVALALGLMMRRAGSLPNLAVDPKSQDRADLFGAIGLTLIAVSNVLFLIDHEISAPGLRLLGMVTVIPAFAALFFGH